MFCNIVKKSTPSYTVYEDDYLSAILDINPSIPGHIVLILKTHYVSIKETTDDEIGHVLIIAKKLSNILMKVAGIKGTTLFIADGIDAGQKAPHALMHIIPRIVGDSSNLSIPENDVNQETLLKVKEKLILEIENDIIGQENNEKNDNKSNGQENSNCPICNIVEKNSHVIYKDQEISAYLPKNPISPYHIQITTNKHFPVIGVVPDKTCSKLLSLAKSLCLTIAKSFNINSSNIIINNGIPANQKYPHMVIDLIPRIKNDGISLNWTPKRADNEMLAKLAINIKGLADKMEEEVPKATKTIKEEIKQDIKEEKDYLIDSLNKKV